MVELHTLLTPNKEHEKVFPNVPAIGFGNGKSLKSFLVRARLPKLKGCGRYEPCEKRNCLVCESISTAATFSTEACQGTFKNVKFVVKSSTLGKQKSNFVIGLIIIN